MSHPLPDDAIMALRLRRLGLEDIANRLDELSRSNRKVRSLFQSQFLFGPMYRHLKRGSVYSRLFDSGVLQSSGGPIHEGAALTTYVGEDLRIWHRPTHEFDDGRFERIVKK